MPKRKVFRDSDDDLESESEGSDLNEEHSDEETQLMAESDSDSDAAPEDIGFSQSKESALKKVTDALNSIKQQKQKLKDKRKDKDTTYKQQKKQKLEALAKTRLPDDFLENIKSAPVVVEEPTPKEIDQREEDENSDQGFLDDMDDDSLGEEAGDDLTEGDFISLGTSQVKAVYIDDHVKSSQTSAERAAEFKSSNLYGKRILRESQKSRQNKLLKKKSRY